MTRRRRFALPTSDLFNAAWNVVKDDDDSIDKSILDYFARRNRAKTQQDKVNAAMAQVRGKRFGTFLDAGLQMGTGMTPEMWAQIYGHSPPTEEATTEEAAEEAAEEAPPVIDGEVTADIPPPETEEEAPPPIVDTTEEDVLSEATTIPDPNDLVTPPPEDHTQTGEITMLVQLQGEDGLETKEINKISLEMAKVLVARGLGEMDEDELWLTEEQYNQLAELFPALIKSEPWSVVENPFANPFYDTSAFSIRKNKPRGFVNPAPLPPMEVIKEEKPPDIEGFRTNDGDDLSLLPASVFAKDNTPARDNVSLLPSGWNDGE